MLKIYLYIFLWFVLNTKIKNKHFILLKGTYESDQPTTNNNLSEKIISLPIGWFEIIVFLSYILLRPSFHDDYDL
jgi:hypothetical protein